MNIIARAEPRYFLELMESDVSLIHEVVLKRAFRAPGKFTRTVELTGTWLQRLELRKDYREVCASAGHDVQTSKSVMATHSELEKVLDALSHPGPMCLEKSVRLSAIWDLCQTMMDTASRQFRQIEMSMRGD